MGLLDRNMGLLDRREIKWLEDEIVFPFVICDLCLFFFFFDEWKICINKEEQKKKKLICISVYVWNGDLCFCGCDYWM